MVPLQPPAAAAPAQVAHPSILRHPIPARPCSSPPSPHPCTHPPLGPLPSRSPTSTCLPCSDPSAAPSLLSRPLLLRAEPCPSPASAHGGEQGLRTIPPPEASPVSPPPGPEPGVLSQYRTGALCVGPAGSAVQACGAPSPGPPRSLLRRRRAVPRGLRAFCGGLHLHPGEPGESGSGMRPASPSQGPSRLPGAPLPLRALLPLPGLPALPGAPPPTPAASSARLGPQRALWAPCARPS